MNLKGADGLDRRLRAIGKAPAEILRTVAISGVREAKLLVPRRTGNLARTIRAGTIGRDYAEIRAGGSRDVGYAAAVELGTKGGQMLRPIHKKALAWGGARRLSGSLRKGGKAVFFSMGHKRGATRAKPYLRPGLQRALDAVGISAVVSLWNGGD